MWTVSSPIHSGARNSKLSKRRETERDLPSMKIYWSWVPSSVSIDWPSMAYNYLKHNVFKLKKSKSISPLKTASHSLHFTLVNNSIISTPGPIIWSWNAFPMLYSSVYHPQIQIISQMKATLLTLLNQKFEGVLYKMVSNFANFLLQVFPKLYRLWPKTLNP